MFTEVRLELQLKLEMFFDSASWRDLGARFRVLLDPSGDLHAIPEDEKQNRWDLSGGPDNDRDRKLLHQQFRDLAREAGVGTGLPNRQNALDGWLILLRDESPYYKRMGKGAVIQSLCHASAEQCETLAIRARELELAAQSGDHPGLRRDRYLVNGWLGDDQHESLADAGEELKRRISHAWHGYRNRVEEYRAIVENELKRGLPVWPDRKEKLREGITGLSYDLAFLQANYFLDSGLRGEELRRAFGKEAWNLTREVNAAWQSNLKDLALAAEESRREMPDLDRPFDRVGADLSHLDQLLGKPSPQNPRPDEAVTELPPTKKQLAGWRKQGRRSQARRAAPDLGIAARLAAESELRKESAIAVQQTWPPDQYHLEQVLWAPLSKYAETVFDTIAEARLRELGSKLRLRHYSRWLRCTCLPAVVGDVCLPMAQFYATAEYVIKVIGDNDRLEHLGRTRRALAWILTEVLGGPHTKNLEKRLQAYLGARIAHWEAKAMERTSDVAAPDTVTPVAPKSDPVEPETPDAEAPAELEVRDWEEVEIRFLSDERVQITIANRTETRNYAEFGFEDGRSKKPNLGWEMLRSLAEAGGTIQRPTDERDWPSIEKRMQELRRIFRNRFKLSDDPLPLVERGGYQARFKISCGPSYNS